MDFKIEYNFRDELKLFINRWGVQMQETMCMEEMSELTKELCKKIRGRDNSKEIIEETADVLITALQMAEIHGYEEVMKVVNYKMQRALNKIDSQLDNTYDDEPILSDEEYEKMNQAYIEAGVIC